MELYLNNNRILTTDIHSFNSSDEYESATISFCKAWLENQTTFQLQTSGSTSSPKIIEVSRAQMEASARATIKALGLKAGDRALICINTAMIGGKMMLVRTFIADLNAYIVQPSSDPFLNIPASYEFDFAALVPLQLETILGNTQSTSRLNKLKAVIVGGAAVSETLGQKLSSLQVPVYSTYGMTETVSHIALKPLNGPFQSEYFKVLDGIQTRLDKRGCLEIKGEVTSNQWITTNDLVKFHNENEFVWQGRIDNVINTGGIKLQIEALENKIGKVLKDQGIEVNFFLSKAPDEKLGEALIFFMEFAEDEKVESELIVLFKETLAKYEVPKKFFLCPKFEYTLSGKVDKLKTKSLKIK